MAKLILIKHSHSQMTPGVPPEEWELSEQGRGRCGALAGRLAAYRPGLIFASEERKAAQTAELIAGELGRTWKAVAGLQEHDRSNVPVMATKISFRRWRRCFGGRTSGCWGGRRRTGR